MTARLPPQLRSVVTGAGSGLGRALCRELTSRGGRVIASDIDLARAEQTVALLPPGSAAFACDVARLADVEALRDHALQRLGGVDLLINNAGVMVDGPFIDALPADVQWLLGVNLSGTLNGCHVFARELVRQGRGAILNVASSAGLLAVGAPAVYVTTKAAIVGLSEALRNELSPHGVSVSVLCPGHFPSNLCRSGRGTESEPDRLRHELLTKDSKLTAEEVARAAVDGLQRGALYILTDEETRWGWRLKRSDPEAFPSRIDKLLAFVMRWRARTG